MLGLDPGLQIAGLGVLLVVTLVIGYAIGSRRKEQTLAAALNSAREAAATRVALRSPRRSAEPEPIESDDSPTKRVLILGLDRISRRVDAWPWDMIPPDINVADYDAVIVNLCPLSDDHYAKSLDVDRIPEPVQFSRLIFSEHTELIFIGEPWIQIGGGGPRRTYREIASYLPVLPVHVAEQSQSIEIVDREFEYYFEGTTDTQYHFEDHLGNYDEWKERHLQYYLGHIHRGANSVAMRWTAIARTRFGKNVALAMEFVAQYQEANRMLTHQDRYPPKDPVDLKKSCPVYWLPSTTGLTDEEAIRRLLQVRYGIHMSAAIPVWIEGFQTPIMNTLGSEVDAMVTSVRDAEGRIAIAQQKLADEAKFTRLLYEQGDPLEDIVRDSLRVLGASVSEPTRRGHEDGRLIDPYGRQAMLEIKGVTRYLKLDHLRALHQWVGDAMAQEQWRGQGILIANTHCSSPIEQRGEMHPSSDFLATLRAYGFIVVNTVDVFDVICLHQSGGLDIKEFWDSIFLATERWRPPWSSAPNR